MPVKQDTLTEKNFIARLKTHQSAAELQKIQRYFKSGKGEYVKYFIK